MREAALQSGEFVSCPAHMVTACLMCGEGGGKGEGLRDEGDRPAVRGVRQLPCSHGNDLFNVWGRGGGREGEGLRDEMREAALQSGEFISCPAHMVMACLMWGGGGREGLRDEGGRPAVRGVRQLPCAHGNGLV